MVRFGSSIRPGPAPPLSFTSWHPPAKLRAKRTPFLFFQVEAVAGRYGANRKRLRIGSECRNVGPALVLYDFHRH
ncbi:hypothetical protein SBV1_790004 [Verrucomicrobia bacterium]|nr:hypothetical protein SBV1_790004 [Verrucomicrobiota bacterium]